MSHKHADDLRIAFIEKKYGDSALAGSAGISKHFNDLYKFLNDNKKVKSIYQEVTTIFNQKIQLGLIPGVEKQVDISENKPEFILLLANHKPAKTVLKEKINGVINSPLLY